MNPIKKQLAVLEEKEQKHQQCKRESSTESQHKLPRNKRKPRTNRISSYQQQQYPTVSDLDTRTKERRERKTQSDNDQAADKKTIPNQTSNGRDARKQAISGTIAWGPTPGNIPQSNWQDIQPAQPQQSRPWAPPSQSQDLK